MLSNTFRHRIKSQLHLQFVLKWLLVAVFVGSLSGSASAVFLLMLDWAKQTRDQYNWLLFLLPLGGVFVAAGYKYFGGLASKGNNLLLKRFKTSRVITFLMAPLVLFGTIITHVFGGSAGREGTVQMGAAIADQFNF